MRRLALATALTTTLCHPVAADGLLTEEAVLLREQQFDQRLDIDFPNSEARFAAARERQGELTEDQEVRLEDTIIRHADTLRRDAEFRETHDLPPRHGTDGESYGHTKAAECEGATHAEKLAWVALAGDKNWDFSCPDAQEIETAVAVDEDPAGVDAATVRASKAATEPVINGAASPIGGYKLTWESDGQGWTTIDRGYPASGHDGYGNVWDNGKNVSHANGVTTLSLTKCNDGGKQHCGAEITTRGLKDFTHGYVEVEARATDGRGQFPAALWMIGDGQWPNSGEIDVHETVKNGRDNDKAFFSAHWAGCGGKCQVSDPNPATVENMDGWNTYGIRRTPDKIEQIVNGKVTGTITRAQAAAKGGNYSVIFDKPMHLRADIGGDNRPGQWATHDSGQIDPGHVQIRNVKVYE